MDKDYAKCSGLKEITWIDSVKGKCTLKNSFHFIKVLYLTKFLFQFNFIYKELVAEHLKVLYIKYINNNGKQQYILPLYYNKSPLTDMKKSINQV